MYLCFCHCYFHGQICCSFGCNTALCIISCSHSGNLQVGNAWTDADIDNFGAIFYWWSHALVSDATYRGVIKTVSTNAFFCHFVDWPSFPYLLTFTCLCDMQCNFSVVGPLLTEADKQCVDFVDSAQNELASQRLQFCVQCILHQFLVAPNRANVSLDACLCDI